MCAEFDVKLCQEILVYLVVFFHLHIHANELLNCLVINKLKISVKVCYIVDYLKAVLYQDFICAVPPSHVDRISC